MSSSYLSLNEINSIDYCSNDDEEYKIVKLNKTGEIVSKNTMCYYTRDKTQTDILLTTIANIKFDDKYANNYICEAIYVNFENSNNVIDNNITINITNCSSQSFSSTTNKYADSINDKYLDNIFNNTEYIQLYNFCLMGNIPIKQNGEIICKIDSSNMSIKNVDLYAKIKKNTNKIPISIYIFYTYQFSRFNIKSSDIVLYYGMFLYDMNIDMLPDNLCLRLTDIHDYNIVNKYSINTNKIQLVCKKKNIYFIPFLNNEGYTKLNDLAYNLKKIKTNLEKMKDLDINFIKNNYLGIIKETNSSISAEIHDKANLTFYKIKYLCLIINKE